MADTTLYMERLRAAGQTATAGVEEQEYTACSFGRVGLKPQVSVTFRKANGSGINLSYSHYYGVTDENPNVGFVVEFTRHTVTVEGRNLERLYRLICDQKGREVCEIDPILAPTMPAGEPVVTRLVVREKRAGEEA